MLVIDPDQVFKGILLIIAPHMDDEVLACGGTLARISNKDRIHVAYATDGTRSPLPVYPWLGAASTDLARVRKLEASAALHVLGLQDQNMHFWDLPDGALGRHTAALNRSLAALVKQLKPDYLFVPFRYDRHPDHLTLHRTAVQMLRSTRDDMHLFEYFVYYRWQLLPGRDVRTFIRPDQLVQVDIQAHSAQKKQALECYKSQTTRYYDWQERPILTCERVSQVSQTPELLLRYDPNLPGGAVLAQSRTWIRFVHLVEPRLKQIKEQMRALMRTGTTRYAGKPS